MAASRISWRTVPSALVPLLVVTYSFLGVAPIMKARTLHVQTLRHVVRFAP